MADDELRGYIKDFLQEFKELINEGKLITADRVNNRNALTDLGLTDTQRREEILSLSVEDYFAGPKDDKYRAGDQYWEFGKKINGAEVYIKLKLRNDWAVCLSFHRAEYPISYPCKQH